MAIVTVNPDECPTPMVCAVTCGGQWSLILVANVITFQKSPPHTRMTTQHLQNISKPREVDPPNILPVRDENPKPETHVSCLSNMCHKLQLLCALLLLISSLAFMSERDPWLRNHGRTGAPRTARLNQRTSRRLAQGNATMKGSFCTVRHICQGIQSVCPQTDAVAMVRHRLSDCDFS